MKQICLIILFFVCLKLYAQSLSADMQLIYFNAENTTKKKHRSYTYLHNSNSQINRFNPVNIFFSGLMYFYQNVLSAQINASCLYLPSCSEFGKSSIKSHGLIKGIFLTADRLSRCNRINAIEIYTLNPSVKGKLPDDCKMH